MYDPTQGQRSTVTFTEGQLEKFKGLVIGHFTTPLTARQNAFIEQRIQELFLGRPVPDHPPYQFMIPNAIKHLNEEGGSSMVTISKFIRENHKNLPWHHEALVKHHLGKLCESGNLIEIHDNCDSIAKASSSCNPRFRVKREGKSTRLNARGIKLHHKKVVRLGRGRVWPRSQGKGKGKSRGRGRGRDRNLSWGSDNENLEEEVGVGLSQVEDKASVHHMEVTQKRVMLEEEANKKGLKETARRLKLHRKCKEVEGLDRGRGRGWSLSGGTGKDQSRGQSLCWDSDNGSPKEQVEACAGQGEDKVSVDHMEATEKQYVIVKDEADEKVQSKGQYQVQGSEDSLNDRSQAAQRAIISEIEPPKQEHRVNEESSASQQENELITADNSARSRTTCWPHGKTFISNKEQEQNEIDLHSPCRGKGRGRLCTMDTQKEETGKKMEQLMEATETLRVEKPPDGVNAMPVLPGLSANAPLVKDFSIDDIPLMVIKDEAAKENLQKKSTTK